MATFTAGSTGLGMDFFSTGFCGLDPSVYIVSTPVHSSTEYQMVLSNGYVTTAYGSNMTYGIQVGGNYFNPSGTVTGHQLADANGNVIYSVSHDALDWQDVMVLMTKGDPTGAHGLNWTAMASTVFAGADTMSGGSVTDKIVGYAGNDQINGLGGDDFLYGTTGNDILNGGDGNDYLSGGTNADTLTGGAGADILVGGTDDDTYMVDENLDVIIEYAGGGFDVVNSSVSLTLSAEVEKLVLTGTAAINGTGNASANTLMGNGGANLLDGAAGNDVLNGGQGGDILIGGLGMDTLIGGGGADVFDFNQLVELGLGSERDVINDFKAFQGDKIDLSGIDANIATVGIDEAFRFIGTASFSSTDATGQVRFSGGVLYGSVDADSAAEFEIKLVGVISLIAGNLVL